MGKKTDYKQLWRRAKEELVDVHNENQRLRNLNKGYADIIQGIKSGDIVVDKIEEAVKGIDD